MVPTQIRQYLLGDPLGSGGMGAVYQARDTNLNRDVALKLIRPDMLTDPDILRRFRQEVEVLKDLEHSAIVPVYDFGGFELDDEEQPSSQDPPFMVMRYMAGGTLHDRLREGPLAPDEATQILKRVAAALDAMHDNGLIHRDLKPRNVFFDSYGEAYLGDFGLVKAVDSATSITGAVGTYAYMSPEQFTGREISPRSDIYALGGLLFTMLTGKRPYHQHSTLSAIMDAHRYEEPPNLHEINPSLPWQMNQIIQQAMAKEPEHRFQTATELANQFRVVVGDPLTPVTNPTALQPHLFDQTVVEETVPPSTRFHLSTTQIIIGAVTVVVLLVVGAVILNQVQSSAAAPEPAAVAAAVTETDTPTPEPTETPLPVRQFTVTPTPLPPYEIFVSRYDSSALWQTAGAEIQRIPANEKLPIPQGETVTLQSDREQLVLNLPGQIELHMLPDTELTLTVPGADNDTVVVDPAEGRFAISAVGQPVEIIIAEMMTATIIGGQIGINRISLRNRVEVDCLSGRCNIHDGFETTQLNAGDQIAVAYNGEQGRAPGIDYAAYAALALVLPTPTTAPTPTPTLTPTPALAGLLDMTPRSDTIEFGRSVEGRPLEVVRIGSGPRRVLFVGGIHAGYHLETVRVAAESAAYFMENPEEIPADVTLYIVLNLNPDSPDAQGEISGRLNANGVDLNRNWECRWLPDPVVVDEIVIGGGGSEPISEPESQGLKEVIEVTEPEAVVFWGSTSGVSGYVAPGLCNTADGPSVPLSISYAEAADYNYPTPPIGIDGDLTGDVSNWLDAEGIPSAFVLLSRRQELNLGRELDGMRAVMNAVAGEAVTDTPAVSGCAADIDPRWRDQLGSREANLLGCQLTAAVDSSRAVYQYFDGGLMIWREDNSTVYVLYNGNDGFETQYIDPGRDVATMYQETNQLRGAIGFVWNSNPRIQSALGEPNGTEQEGGDFVYQEFEQGQIFTFKIDQVERTFVMIEEEDGETRWFEL